MVVMTQYYLKRLLLLLVSSFAVLNVAYSQNALQDSVHVNEYFLKLEKRELLKVKDGCDLIQNIITLQKQGVVVFEKVICSVYLEDVEITQKGYLTVIDHYGSPVDWCQSYVFDFCKKRLIITDRMGEGTQVNYLHFVDFRGEKKAELIEKVIKI